MQKLVADFDHRTQLVRGKGCLTESGVGLRDLFSLIDPLRFHRIVGNGNLTGTAVSLDDRCHLAEDVVFLKRLNQTALELVGHSVAALGVLADGECVADCKLIALVADHIPERTLVLVRCGRVSGRRVLCAGSVGDGLGGRCGKCRIHGCLLFQTLDLCAESLHICRHFVVGFHSTGLHKTVFTPVLLKKCFRLFPQGIALAAQFHDFAHIFSPFLPDISGGHKITACF